MEDYIDPWVGLWVAIFLWGLWFYIVVKEAKRARIKVLVEEDLQQYKDVKVFKRVNTQWVQIGTARLLPGESVSEYVRKVVNSI